MSRKVKLGAHCSECPVPARWSFLPIKRLLSAALNYCRDASVDSVWLTTNAENEPAIGFYLAKGFEHVGETHFRIDDQGYMNNVYRFDLL